MRTVSRFFTGGLVAVALVALAGCSATPSSEPGAGATESVPQATSTTDAGTLGTAADPVRVAIVGDSLTAGGGRMLSWGLTPDTWITYAEGDGVDYVGGWAKGGTTVEQQAANVTAIPRVDVLVLMAGTNDVRHGISFAEAEASYDSIVKTLHPKHVIIGAIPPNDRHPQQAAVYERQLKAYVATTKWDFVDPWSFARDGLVYRSGTSIDGIHPTTSGYRKIGETFRSAILRVVSHPVKG